MTSTEPWFFHDIPVADSSLVWEPNSSSVTLEISLDEWTGVPVPKPKILLAVGQIIRSQFSSRFRLAIV
jgi:hypothetical protein